MRSRSYYAIAVSSFLLLTISCVAQKAKHEDLGDRPLADVSKADVKADVKAEKGAEGYVNHALWDFGPVMGHLPDEGETGSEHVGTSGFPAAGDGDGDGEDDSGPEPGPSSKGKDGCRRGQMRFDGKCMSKDRVSKILDKRGAAAREKVKNAKKPQQTAEASYDMIKQQTQQMGKVEDDLDEIIEQLEREKAEKAEEGGTGGS